MMVIFRKHSCKYDGLFYSIAYYLIDYAKHWEAPQTRCPGEAPSHDMSEQDWSAYVGAEAPSHWCLLQVETHSGGG